MTSAQYGDDYRSDENINYVNRGNEPTFEGDVIAVGGKASLQGTKLPPFKMMS